MKIYLVGEVDPTSLTYLQVDGAILLEKMANEFYRGNFLLGMDRILSKAGYHTSYPAGHKIFSHRALVGQISGKTDFYIGVGYYKRKIL